MASRVLELALILSILPAVVSATIITNCSPSFSTILQNVSVGALYYLNGVEQNCAGNGITLSVSPTTNWFTSCDGNKFVYAVYLENATTYNLTFRSVIDASDAKTCLISRADIKPPGGVPETDLLLVPLVAVASLLFLRRASVRRKK